MLVWCYSVWSYRGCTTLPASVLMLDINAAYCYHPLQMIDLIGLEAYSVYTSHKYPFCDKLHLWNKGSCCKSCEKCLWANFSLKPLNAYTKC